MRGILEQFSEKHLAIRLDRKWYPCTLAMFNNIRSGPFKVGDVVEIDLNSFHQVKSIVIRQKFEKDDYINLGARSVIEDNPID